MKLSEFTDSGPQKLTQEKAVSNPQNHQKTAAR